MLLFVQLVSTSFFATPVFAAAPTNIISYQGRLLNSNRAPVSSSSASILFELYTASSGGTCVWSNSSSTCASATARTVTLTDGLFSENLGDTADAVPYAAIGDAIFGNNSTLFLQVTVNGETLNPRKQIAAAPYALNAQLLDGLDADADGGTAAAIVAYNSSGNLVVTGNPSGSGVSNGSIYINPDSGDVAANDTLLGIATSGSVLFRVDAEGDTNVVGGLSLDSGSVASSSTTANLFDDTTGTTRVDIGGVDTARANIINIATNSTSADTITIGNTHASTLVAITGGNDWSIGSDGAIATLTTLDVDGSATIGDTTGADSLTIASGATTTDVISMTLSTLTTGAGLVASRAIGGADFDGTVAGFNSYNTASGSDGDVVAVFNGGGGNAVGLYIVQNTVSAQVANATGNNALVIDVNEASGSENVMIIRSDADGTPDTEFRVENDGDVFGDGATYTAGADYAEFFPILDRTLSDYEVVCWNAEQENGVKRCAAGDTNVIGVISTNPGFVGNNLVGAGGSLEDNVNYALVGLVGQIDTHVSADAGAIKVGDPLTTSSVRAGYAAKATKSAYIIGRALEALPSGTGTIKVLVQPMWYGGDMLTMNGEATAFIDDIILEGAQATAADTAVDSAGLVFVGSAWNGSSANDVSLSIRNTVLENGNARLSLQNDDGVDVMTFGSMGDLALAGNFYPSDRGALQYGAYVYYDSTDAGYMRTNAAGWSSNSSSFAESFTSSDLLVPGDVVEFAVDGSGVVRSSGEAYSNRIAGVVSSRSAFVAGSSAGTYPVAFSGRVSTKVSAENGAITPGDALTTSSRAGFAMKATDSGEIIGYALESWASGEGSILVFVRPQYVHVENLRAPASLAVGSQDIENLNVSGVLSMNGGDIVSVGTLSGIGTWEIRENGDIVTNGQLTQVVESLQNTRVSTYAMTSTETIVQLSGTSTLHNGMARVNFEDIDQDYNDIISPDGTYRVLVTPNGVTGQLYVTDRSNAGFIIRDANQGEGVSVDWLVLAYRYDVIDERGSTGVTDSETDVTPPLVSSGVTDESIDGIDGISLDDGGIAGIEEGGEGAVDLGEVPPVENSDPVEGDGRGVAPGTDFGDAGTLVPGEIVQSPEILSESAP